MAHRACKGNGGGGQIAPPAGILQYIDIRITTGIVEELNSKIKTAMKRAYGFKSFEYLRTVSTSSPARSTSRYPLNVEETHLVFGPQI
jgi:hypothetical protein